MARADLLVGSRVDGSEHPVDVVEDVGAQPEAELDWSLTIPAQSAAGFADTGGGEGHASKLSSQATSMPLPVSDPNDLRGWPTTTAVVHPTMTPSEPPMCA
ncbi:MAG: hypothetical protein ACRDYY_17495, partial [Acidimicrobiales bacterium]